jgi:hypothetical protein
MQLDVAGVKLDAVLLRALGVVRIQISKRLQLLRVIALIRR